MTFNPESIGNQASTFFNISIIKGREYLAQLQENPTEFLKSNAKVLIIAAVFFTSLVFVPLFTAGACVTGFLYSKNVSKVESEYEEFFKDRSPETKAISIFLLTTVTLLAGKVVLPLAIGAHVGMLLSNHYYESAEGPLIQLDK